MNELHDFSGSPQLSNVQFFYEFRDSLGALGCPRSTFPESHAILEKKALGEFKRNKEFTKFWKDGKISISLGKARKTLIYMTF